MKKKQSATKKPTVTAKKDAKVDEHAGHAHTYVVDNITFKLVIPWNKIEEARDHALNQLAKEAQLNGFRKGKAPRKLVEERLGKQKVFEAALDIALPVAYSEEIEKKKLNPVTSPQIDPISLEEGKDWEFTVTTAEAPTVELGDYKGIIRGAKAKLALWTPGKDQKKEEPSEDERLRAILGEILENIHVKVPELLVRQEVNRSLSKLIQQIERLKLSLDDYLKSIGKTVEEIRQEYATAALTSVQLDFILSKVAREEKLDIPEKDVDELIAQLPNEELKKANNTPQQRLNIKANLLRRRTVDFLLSL